MERFNKCKDCKRYFRTVWNLCNLAEMELVSGDSDACESFAPDSPDDLTDEDIITMTKKER